MVGLAWNFAAGRILHGAIVENRGKAGACQESDKDKSAANEKNMC